MKLRTFVALAALLALPALTTAQDQRYYQKRAPLAYQWDLDGEAADDDQVVTAANGALTDSKTFTKTADPDTPRLVDITVTDADSSITAGVLTLVGTDSLGYAKTCTHTFTGAGSGVKTLVCTDGTGAYFATISSITTGVLTGEGAGDVVIVGYTSNSANGWGMWGKLVSAGPSGEHAVDPFGSTTVALPITTSGALSTTVTSVGSNGAFTNVQAGDLLLFEVSGSSYERKVTARASADSITINSPGVVIPAAGVTFAYKRFYFSSNPADLVAVPVTGFESASFVWGVLANADTGGVVAKLECAPKGPGFPISTWTEMILPVATIASGATTVATGGSGGVSLLGEHVDTRTTGYDYCRMGFRFGTGDDADASPEQITVTVSLMSPSLR